jgi:poly-gamma-glutamate synthesis protein (capsule biosynthesis protein)
MEEFKWNFLIFFAIIFFFNTSAEAQKISSESKIKQESLFDINRPLERESITNVPDGFRVIAVGDLIISRPLSQYAGQDRAFSKILNAMKNSDVVYGNMESTILDLRNFTGYPYSFEGDWTNSSLPSVADDLKKMGFSLVSRANNHALDWGLEGMRETSKWLDKSEIKWTGVGENRGQARAPGFFESPKGRVALVSFASTYRPTTDSLPAHGAAPARPGLSALSVSQIIYLPADNFKTLLKLKCNLYSTECESVSSEFNLFGRTFRQSNSFYYEFIPNEDDVSEIYQSIRSGKQNADFLIASIHAHECSVDCDDVTKPEIPAAFLRPLAHDAIDSGADVFVTTGIHNIGPIEIYHGRPIFYGLGNFFWTDIQLPLPYDLYQQNKTEIKQAFLHAERATDYDLTALLNARSFANAFTFQTVLAQSIFAHNQLSSIQLYAVDLGYGRKLTESGIPRLATPEKASVIFKAIQDANQKYGLPLLNMSISGSIATIKP